MTKSKDIVRYNPSDYDLHPGLKLVLGGRKIWKEKIRNAGYSNEIITWVFKDGTTESYMEDENKKGIFIRVFGE